VDMCIVAATVSWSADQTDDDSYSEHHQQLRVFKTRRINSSSAV